LADPFWSSKTRLTESGSQAEAIDHQLWDAFLHRHRRALQDYDYAAIQADLPALERYVLKLEQIDPRSYSNSEQKAFWLNAYLAAELRLFLQRYPVSSVQDIQPGIWHWLGLMQEKLSLSSPVLDAFKPGPWKIPVLHIAGRHVSLSHIQHRILRPLFNDPRIHFVIHPFARSGSDFPLQAFAADRVEKQLHQAAVHFINRGDTVRQIGNTNEYQLNRIWHWYRLDFGGSEASVMRILMRYSQRRQRAQLAQAKGSFDYYFDWRLNDPGDNERD
jgi:hypothetical protein